MRRLKVQIFGFLLLLLPAGVATENNFDKSSLLLPRDVAYDNGARKALQKIRRRQDYEEILSNCGNDNQATMTMVGYKGGRIQDQVNQDRSFVLSPFSIENYEEPSLLLGVFDGHGYLGEVVAQYALQELPQRLGKKLETMLFQQHVDENKMDDVVKKALMDTFIEIDKSIPTNGQGGCTASVMLQLGPKLYIANAGDSVSLVAVHSSAQNKTQVVYVTRQDKPHLPDEYDRILTMGGAVNIPKNQLDDSSRVMYTDPDTGYQMGLAMSRSIGDWEMVGVIAEPIVDVLDLQELIANATTMGDDATCRAADELCQAKCIRDIHVFCISATDGMMDYVTPQELATSFANAFYQPDSPHPLTVAEDLILAAANGWNVETGGEYRDDIAIAASKVPTEKLLDNAAKDEPP